MCTFGGKLLFQSDQTSPKKGLPENVFNSCFVAWKKMAYPYPPPPPPPKKKKIAPYFV